VKMVVPAVAVVQVLPVRCWISPCRT
jgi:hypothetical protein